MDHYCGDDYFIIVICLHNRGLSSNGDNLARHLFGIDMIDRMKNQLKRTFMLGKLVICHIRDALCIYHHFSDWKCIELFSKETRDIVTYNVLVKDHKL